jgi:hypothetical protein
MPRTGSFLLFAIALIAVLVALGFALLQAIRLSGEAGTSTQRAWLAQQAALAGVDHALENILTDYRTPGRPTFLDGSWHRDFYAVGRDRNQPGSATIPGADDDVRDENMLWAPLGFSDNGYQGYHGNLYAQYGKARYYEVDYYDPSDRTAARFTDGSAAMPPRNGALLLDARLLRITAEAGETLQQLRARARYRLRYAVIVNDAGANILINPALDVDYRDAWRPGEAALAYAGLPAGDPYKTSHYQTRFAAAAVFAPTALGRRLERYSQSLYNMLEAAPSNATEGSVLRLLHVFRLRGSAANVAQDANGWPAAFPNMLRKWSDATTCRRTMFGSKDADSVGLGLYKTVDGVVRLEGGQPIRSNTVSNDEGPASHSLIGPQFSFRNVLRATAGNALDINISGSSSNTASADQQLGLVTPFGRAGEQGTRSQPWQWNRGPSDVPWVVNALTAPSGVTSAMIGGYMPPALNGVKLTIEKFYCYQGTDSDGRDVYYPCSKTITLPSSSAKTVVARRGRDLFTDFMSPAFEMWPAPWALAQYPDGSDNTDGPKLWPNVVIPDPRPSTEVYPGPYASCARLSPDPSALAPEDTGKDVDADSVYICDGWDSHSDRELVVDISGTETRYRGGDISEGAGNYASTYTNWQLSRSDNRTGAIETPMPTGVAGATGTWGYHPKDYIKSVPDPSVYRLQDSYFYDIKKAFATAVAVMRGHWVQVANDWMDPVASFPAGRLAQSEVDGVDDLDRLFLRQLGIDIAQPDSSTVVASWKPEQGSGSGGLPRIYRQNGVVLANNIRSLVVGDLLKIGTLTSAMRARAMELMLNDWRMSFLGASPEYASTFRPLDFDGDGWAICSGYSVRSSFSDDVAGVSWPRRPAVSGIGEQPDIWFSLTGCFTVSKSHYYRILVRGELWDNLASRAASTATMETVVSVDADGDAVPSATASLATGLDDDVTVLYQRWYWNRYNGLLPTIYP